ncbi:MAG: hypothetical protein JXQ90_10210 [Cyclobacteriaceae bacterium]
MIRFLLLLAFPIALFGQTRPIQVAYDLTKVKDDRIAVTIFLPKLNKNDFDFCLPKVVPGTYSVSDFGRFVSDLKVFNEDSSLAQIQKVTSNRWHVSADKPYKITYLIDDSFDRNNDYKNNFIFEPEASNFGDLAEVFVLNNFGIVGYIKGYEGNVPYVLTITHDPNHFGATSLTKRTVSKQQDIYQASNYHQLVDAPIMYTEPDTARKKVAGADILISIYSPSDKLSSKKVMDDLDEIIDAQAKYLNDQLPVDRYTYLIYLSNKRALSGSWGALEHNNSSMYVLPENMAARAGQLVKDIAAHEFMHIITPLNLHSEEIHNFDYQDPKMSRHLWLYEGVTEYFSHHLQVRAGLVRKSYFLDIMSQKMKQADRYDLVPFTTMSEQILTRDYKHHFDNVYEKGALIAMCLDLLILHHSEGQQDLYALIDQLSETYGPDKPFTDSLLFDQITQLTHDQIGEFLTYYVDKAVALPVMECLSYVGLELSSKDELPTLGNIFFEGNSDNQVVITNIDELNKFGQKIDYQVGDVLISVDDVTMTSFDNFKSVDQWKQKKKANEDVIIRLSRIVNGEKTTLIRTEKAQFVSSRLKNKIVHKANITEEQRLLQSAWLNGLSK